MTDASPASHEDLAYVRRLAESGARSPLIGGRFMAWWGLLGSLAYAAHHLALSRTIGDGDTIFFYLWSGFVALGLLGQVVLVRTMPAKAGEGSAGNRASRAVWLAAAFAIASMVTGTVILSQSAGPAVFDWIVPTAFAVYGCALIVSGALAGDRIVQAAGAASIVMVGLFAASILHPDRYLLAAAGIAATVLLPGLLLLAREPRAQG